MISLLFQDNKTCQIAAYLCMCFMIILQLWPQIQSCDIKIEDDLWSYQWYLNNSAAGKYDMNILPAWINCKNGTGVTVGVVDTGVQDHFDLNIDRQISLGDGITTIGTLQHGTNVAGIIGALKNDDFVIGIAFGSVIADIQIASKGQFGEFNESALIHRKDEIDVYSCSFANDHTGTKTFPLLEEQENVFEIGTTEGRNGLGSVYVFGTGNNGNELDLFYDSCAYDRLVTNRYVISVAGIHHNLTKVPSGEACSAMMVAAFTAIAGDTKYRIVTTDVGNDSTESFSKNSAATPMVSGAVALAISANPYLSYRDVMHLLVITSRADFPEFEEGNYFMRNAANLSVSSYFGFGLLDIGALVEQSLVWKSVPALKNCSVSRRLNNVIGISDHMIYVNACDITYVEHVEVSLEVNNQNAGQIQWILVSPYKTRSTILPGRRYDGTSYMNITVLTVQMWGENPIGYWKLEPKAQFRAQLDAGTVESYSLVIHGFTCIPDFNCLQPAVQESPVVTTPIHNPTVKADEFNRWNILYGFIGLVVVTLFLFGVLRFLHTKRLSWCSKEAVGTEPVTADHKMQYI